MNFKDAYHPTKGVKTDFSNLLEKFSELETVRYQPFAEIWRSMKFSFLGAGRKTDGECREFFEEVNHIALNFYLPPYNFQVRVGGLYILYGLYVTQPCIPKVPIRVTLDQWKQIQEFQANARKQEHLDVEYVFQKLFCQKAFLFVATPHEVYIKAKDRDRHERGKELESTLTSKLKEVAVSVPKVFTPEIMQQLQAIHTQYQHLKLGLAGPNAVRPDRSLDVVEDEIITNVDECLKVHKQKLEKIRSIDTQKRRNMKRKQGDSDSEEPGDSDADDPDFMPVPKSSQARVKAQAYAQKAKLSKGRRHRSVLTQDASGSSPEKVSRKSDKRCKEGEEEEEEETFLSSSVEESSENMLSPQEYLSMPTLEDTGTQHKETAKSKKTVKKCKEKKETQKSPKTKTKTKPKSSPKKTAKKFKGSEPDNTGDDKSETSGKTPAKKKTKTNSSKPKAKAKVSPVKKVVKGKRKQSVEGEATPGEPVAKVLRMSPKATVSGPATPSKQKNLSPTGTTKIKSKKASPAKLPSTMKIEYRHM